MTNPRFDLAVIGGGEAGIAAAAQAAESGAKTCLIEKSPLLGGACVATGTLPSKVFSISAGMLELARKLGNFGVRVSGEISLDFKEVLASRQRLTRCDQGVIQTHLKSQRVEVVRGKAVLRSKSLIHVESEPGQTVEIEAPRVILASGSRPTELPDFPADGKTILTTDDLVGVTELPARMLVVGAGVIGCEYAFIFRTFGVEVALVEKLEHALSGQDVDIVAAVEKELKRKGVRYLPGTMLTGHARTQEGLVFTTDKGEEISAGMAIICTGRKPATETLGLEEVGVKTGPRGEVLVDARLESSVPGIFAAGDVLGRRMVSSTAILEGGLAAGNAMGGNRELDERFVSTGIYTMPEIGSAGMTEAEAAAREIPVIVGKCTYSRLVKACGLYAHGPGLIKMIFEKGSGRLIGTHIIGAEAAELIHLPAAAMRLGAKAEDFIYSIYHHPSFCEGFREAAKDAVGKPHE